MDQANRRRLVKTGTLSAGVLLLAVLLVIVNYFGWKYYKRFDWTSSQLYSLSDKTKNVLKGLNRDVDFIVFMSPDQQRDLYQPTNELLQRYGAASRHVHVKFLDLEKNPLEAQSLSQQYGVTTQGVVVASGKDKRVISSADLADIDSTSGEPRITGYKGEQLFTSAILQLSEGRKPKILFTTGHGERSLDDQQGNGGLALAQQLLGRDNFDLSEWASLGKSAVPPGTDLLVIAGPTSTFLQPELDAFSAYLNGGGRMLVLLDPALLPGGGGLVKTGLEGWLARYGIKAGQDIVVDPAATLPFMGPETMYISSYGEHPITKAFAGAQVPVLLSLVRSMAGGNAPGIKITELMRTSPRGWGETDLAHLDRTAKDAADVAGPVPVGVVAESAATAPGKKPMRLAAIGDSDFAGNQLLQANQPNALLLANTLNWLVEREALLGIPPKKTEQVRLTLTGDEIRKVYFVAALLPILSIVLGGYVFSRRRR